MKYVEKSGRQLAKLFPIDDGSKVCFRDDCSVCKYTDGKKPTLCQVKGVIYQGVCLLCDKEHKLNPPFLTKVCM